MRSDRPNIWLPMTAIIAFGAMAALAAPVGSQTQPLPPLLPVDAPAAPTSPLVSGAGDATPARPAPSAETQDGGAGAGSGDLAEDRDGEAAMKSARPASEQAKVLAQAVDRASAAPAERVGERPAGDAKETAASASPRPAPRVVLEHPGREQRASKVAAVAASNPPKQPVVDASRTGAPVSATIGLPLELRVAVDRASVVRVPENVRSLLIGNPMIVDVAVQKSGIAVVTGKAPGSTNVVALDEKGRVVSDSDVIVSGFGARSHVTIIQAGKQPTRQTYVCAGLRCDEAISPGDSNAIYTETAGRYRQYGQDQRQAAQVSSSSVALGEAGQQGAGQSGVPLVPGAEPLAGAPPVAFPNAAPRPAGPGPASVGSPGGASLPVPPPATPRN